MKTVLTFGTFDLFHVGHVRILERAASLGRVVVGISSDSLNQAKKGRVPVFPLADRMEIIRSCRFVSDVFVEESLELKDHYIRTVGADYLVMGDDWRGRFDEFCGLCQVVYFPRTENISSTETCVRAASLAPEHLVAS